MIAEEDVQRYAEFIAGHIEAATHQHREAARAVLEALHADGRLLSLDDGVREKQYQLPGGRHTDSLTWASMHVVSGPLFERWVTTYPDESQLVGPWVRVGEKP